MYRDLKVSFYEKVLAITMLPLFFSITFNMVFFSTVSNFKSFGPAVSEYAASHGRACAGGF